MNFHLVNFRKISDSAVKKIVCQCCARNDSKSYKEKIMLPESTVSNGA